MKISKDMKKIAIYIMVLLAAVSCDKNAEYDVASSAKKAEYNRTLGLLSKYNVLSNEGGSTQVAVFSNTDWTVEMDRQVDWASIDRFGGHKSGYLVFDYEINYGRARRVILVFRAGGETMTLNMYQSARISDSDCVLSLGTSSVDAPSVGMTMDIPFITNLYYELDEMYLTITYPPEQEPETPWIILKSVERDKVTIEIAPNDSDEARTANVRLTHTDAGSYDSTEGDSVYSNIVSVTQSI